MSIGDLKKALIEAEVAFLNEDQQLQAAPISLNPIPLSRVAFNQALSLQPLFNELVLRTVQNSSLLEQVCTQLALQDDFVANLFAIYQAQESKIPRLFFNINRSDYMIEEDNRIFQVELNTVSASLAGLSDRLAHFQRSNDSNEIPPNDALADLAAGFIAALNLYHQEYSPTEPLAIVFVVQPGERNRLDQLHLQRAIEAASTDMEIKIIRKTLSDSDDFQVKDGRLVVTDSLASVSAYEVAIVYYRAGYSPHEYASSLQWQVRAMLEATRAIKCPDIAAHLAGLKKIQQILTVHQKLLETMHGDVEKCDQLETCFVPIYGLDAKDPQTAQVIAMARENPNRFVLKPQREGGGNNYYDEQILDALQSLSSTELSAHILMTRIHPRIQHQTLLLQSSSTQAHAHDTISELGIYGSIVALGHQIIHNGTCGWLLRTKPANFNEGGVMAGFSCLSSLTLQ